MCAVDLEYRWSFMASTLAPRGKAQEIQPIHTDFHPEQMGNNGDLYNVIIPITFKGSTIQLWPKPDIEMKDKVTGYIFNIRCGTALIIEAETPHAGGYRNMPDFEYNRIGIHVARRRGRFRLPASTLQSNKFFGEDGKEHLFEDFLAYDTSTRYRYFCAREEKAKQTRKDKKKAGSPKEVSK